MKTILRLNALLILLIANTSLSFAEMGIEHVSKVRAAALGIELRLKGNGPNEVWVEMEFKTVGELKDFNQVSLEISDAAGKLLLGYAPLQALKSDNGGVHVGFMANRVFLEHVTLRIVTGQRLGRSGHDLRVRDFVELKKSP